MTARTTTTDTAHHRRSGFRGPLVALALLGAGLAALTGQAQDAELQAIQLGQAQVATPAPFLRHRVDRILDAWHNPMDPTVLVVAHRAAWHHAPENSIRAIEAAIELGCDMVEIDVRRTGDGHLILMHDTTLDRTTTGTGPVDAATLDQIRSLRLKERDGSITDHAIPTLEEALLVCRGRVLVNLDKAWGFAAEAIAVAERTGTADHLLFKAGLGAREIPAALEVAGLALHDSPAEAKSHPSFMPIVTFRADADGATIRRTLETFRLGRADSPLPAIEICYDGTVPADRAGDLSDLARHLGTRAWINTLWDSISGGRSDSQALRDPESVWGWYIDRGYTVIQTDEPEALLRFLRSRGRRW